MKDVFDRAVALQRQGHDDEAATLYRAIITAAPAHFGARYMLGRLRSATDGAEAIALFISAAVINPRPGICYRGIAQVHAGGGDLVEAKALIRRALVAAPNDDANHFAYGQYQTAGGQQNTAIKSFRRAALLAPELADAHGEVATLVLAEGDSHAALRNTSQALVLRPDWPELLFNRGNVLRVLKRTDDAIASYDQTVALNPDFARAYWNKSHILLNRGDFAAGWPLYEWRWHLPDKAAARAFGPPRWDGTQDLSGKTLLISCEQGLGDAIQCARFLPILARRAQTVIVEVRPPLTRLFATLNPNIQLVAQGGDLPDFDFHCPIMSLPLVTNLRLNTIPGVDGYLDADPDLVASWRARLGPRERPRVGLVWHTNSSDKSYQTRSVPLNLLMAQMPAGLEFVSLHKEYVAEEQASLDGHPSIRDLSADNQDFATTAAICANLDLVISIDTSVAHLAGAMAVPTWILLPQPSDWRWLETGAQSPWYASARLFRQTTPGDWSTVLGELHAALKVWRDRTGLPPAAALIKKPGGGGRDG